MITGVVLARNESRHITDCLKSLKPYVGELILIDMESEDDTVTLAKPYVDKILTAQKTPNFDSSRNLAIPEARFDWLWYLDADERVSEETAKFVHVSISQVGRDISAIWIPFKTHFCGKWIEHSGWWPGYTMPRVLKRGRFHFPDRLHSGVQVEGRHYYAPPDPKLGIEHFSYASVEHYLEKFNRYTSTEAKQFQNENALLDCESGIREMVRDWHHYYERCEGHKDGIHGWILAWLSGQYRWCSRAKLLDSTPRETADKVSVPPNLDFAIEVMQDELARQRALAPSGPMGVVLHSPLWDPSGYAEDGRTILHVLAQGERQLLAKAIPWNEEVCPLPRADRTLFRSLENAKRSQHSIAITNCIATLVSPDPAASFNILRTTNETDRIPPFWLPRLEGFDEIWVLSSHNARAFRQSGVPPEKIRVIHPACDTEVFRPEGPKKERPAPFSDKFVFLSVFDWQLRKGWDVLLKAYVAEIQAEDGAVLLLKITRQHGHSMEAVQAQVRQLLSDCGTSPEARPDIVLFEETCDAPTLASLYRSCDAFVLASRGEGWGRPYMEAMACGLPTIGTRGSGNDDFMNQENAFLVEVDKVPVPELAIQEIPVFAGHYWNAPQIESLRAQLRNVFADRESAKTIGLRAAEAIRQFHSLEALQVRVAKALGAIEQRLIPAPVQKPLAVATAVELEGEFFAGHSFSNINEELALGLSADVEIELTCTRRILQPTQDRITPSASQIRPLLHRSLGRASDVVIRHAFPPNWNLPASPVTKWVHIQPWEFGVLPIDWITPLKYQVDEIWAPSEYVKEVYVRSGIASEKIVVIPWGIDETLYHPQTPPLHLATSKSFRLLFVGGAIGRKGFDTLLAAYLQEFQRDEDVCLVIKDLGTQTYYRGSPLRDALQAAMQDHSAPEILYLDSDLTPGLRASLYTACQVLVAPYRGEGFGLPVLEAMACGLVPVVPRGGPTDDFTREPFTEYLASEVVPTQHDWRLVGQPTELSIEVAELRQVLRKLYEQRETLGERGKLASDFAHQNHSWRKNIFPIMADRLRRLRDDSSPPVRSQPIPRALGARAVVPHRLPITACFLTRNHEACIAEALARVTPFVDQVLIGDLGSTDNSISIAQEYGAQVIPLTWEDSFSKAYNHLLRRAGSEWNFLLEPGDYLADADWKQLAILMEDCSERVRGIQFELVGRPWHAMAGVRLIRNDWRIECVFRAYPTPAPTIHLSDGDLLASGIPLLRDQRIEPVIEHEQLLEKLLQLDLGEHRNESEIHLALAHRRLQEGDWCHAECYLHDGLRLIAPSDPRYADVQGALEKCQQALASLIGCDAVVGIAPPKARREFAGASS